MPIPNPTREQLEAAEREIMVRRGERALAAEQAAREEAAERGRVAQEAAANPSPPPPPSVPRMSIQFGWAAPNLTEAQALEMAQAMRAGYDFGNPELVELQEARLKAAFAKEG